jgi:hypothetical protein
LNTVYEVNIWIIYYQSLDTLFLHSRILTAGSIDPNEMQTKTGSSSIVPENCASKFQINHQTKYQ